MSTCNQPPALSPIRSFHVPGIALAVLVFFGCSPPGGGGDRDAAMDAGTVELGAGSIVFEPLADEDELILWAGPQGGHHFIVHARIKDMVAGDWERPGLPGNPITAFMAFDENDRQVDLMVPPYALGYRDRGDEWMYFPSGRFLRTEEAYVPELFGHRIRVVVEVQDANGVRARDERWIVAVHEPDLDSDAGPASGDAGL